MKEEKNKIMILVDADEVKGRMEFQKLCWKINLLRSETKLSDVLYRFGG